MSICTMQRRLYAVYLKVVHSALDASSTLKNVPISPFTGGSPDPRPLGGALLPGRSASAARLARPAASPALWCRRRPHLPKPQRNHSLSLTNQRPPSHSPSSRRLHLQGNQGNRCVTCGKTKNKMLSAQKLRKINFPIHNYLVMSFLCLLVCH